LLDVEKAFDQAWREGLLRKLRSISVPHGLYNVLKLYLNGGIFSVRVGSTGQPLRSLTAGAPQGSLLSPLLFASYVSDLPLTSNPNTRIALYLMTRPYIPLRSLPPCYASIHSAILTPLLPGAIITRLLWTR
jgi:hypothetical protein